jgi:hypothetical protein
MNGLILVAASFVIIVVALEVLSAMRPGITAWVQFPAWLCIAMAAFFTMMSDRPAAWHETAMAASMAGMMWRYRHRLVWDVRHGRAAGGRMESGRIG